MRSNVLAALRPALVLVLLFAVLTGLAYPFMVLGIGQLLFPRQANGSLIVDHGQVTGSELIGQTFASARYFHGRPSAAGKGYDANSSGGSNLGPTSKALHDRMATDVAALRKSGVTGPVPADLVTASASGLDPDISPEAALLQVPGVAAARHLTEDQVRAMVQTGTDKPLLGILGEQRVNVLLLNRQLDRMTATHSG